MITAKTPTTAPRIAAIGGFEPLEEAIWPSGVFPVGVVPPVGEVPAGANNGTWSFVSNSRRSNINSFAPAVVGTLLVMTIV